MSLKIPFVKNPGSQCMQANMAMALKYFYPEKNFTLDEVNERMKRKTGKWTHPTQGAVVLSDYGLDVKSYSSEDIETEYKKVEASYKKWFGKDYDKLIKYIDLDVNAEFNKRGKEEDVFEIKKHSLDDLEGYVKSEYIVIPCVDYNVLRKKEGVFLGHFITLKDIDDEFVYIVNPNDESDVKYSRDLFNKAYTVPEIEDDVLVVFGKK